jgi:hypothetical protein
MTSRPAWLLQSGGPVRPSTLFVVVAAVASGSAAGCNGATLSPPCGSTAPTQTSVEIDRPAPPATEFRIERCQADVGACLDLCTFVETGTDTNPNPNGGGPGPLLPNGPGGVVGPGSVISCTAGFVGDSKVELSITLASQCLLPGAPVNAPVVGGGK